jgi:predicted Zn-dependent protease
MRARSTLWWWVGLAWATAAGPGAASEGDTSAWSRLTLRGFEVDAALVQSIPLPTNTLRSPVEQELENAAEALRRQDPLAASTALRDVVRLDPENQAARFVAASALIQAARYREARELLEGLLERRPGDYPLMNNLAWLLATAEDPALRDPARAVQLAREAMLIAPSDFHVWNTLAEAHYVHGDYEKALRAGQEALRLARDQGAPDLQKANYEKQVLRFEQAVRAFSLVE